MKIRELIIYSANFEEQVRFYSDRLGFPVQQQNDSSVSFLAGHTIFTLISDPHATPYHIAFNIVPGRERRALEWLKARLVILKDEGDELVRFDAWNAMAMYFYDADRNIVEFIARRDLPAEADGPFGTHDILGISEVGMPVTDIGAAFSAVNAIGSIPLYDGNFDKFCAAGDPQGLLILINRDKKTWFPTNDTAFSSSFSIRGDVSFDFAGGTVTPPRES
ncbi:MAG TPA: hypothetical protein VGD92_09630 [Sphingobacteriaceae bacterium]